MTLGKYPSHRYTRSWITQRLVNRAPAWSQIRKSPTSIGQQILNPIGLEIQDTIQQLTRERFNQHISSADIKQLGILYRFDLSSDAEFSSSERADGTISYIPPAVYATIGGTEYQITPAENNDIKSLGYDCLPSRIEDGEESYEYDSVIPRTLVPNLDSAAINPIVIDSHLYITVRDNTNWSLNSTDKIYYSKLYITGETRKGTTLTETIPIRYNCTIRTINEWHSISTIFVSYLSDSASVTVETFPFDRESYLDTFNVLIESDVERFGFIRLEDRSYGSSIVTEGFVSSDFDIIRSGHDEKEIYFEVGLLDDNNNSVNATDFFVMPGSRFAYCIDASNLYVYDISMPYPDARNMSGESSETKMDLCADKWVCNKDEEVYIKTRTLSFSDLPVSVRWSILSPLGTSLYLNLDGTTTTDDSWIENSRWGNANQWEEQHIPLTFSEFGEWVITLEGKYWSNSTNASYTLTTKFLFFVPSITPEIQLELPASLLEPEKISIDSDGIIWLLKYGVVHRLNTYHDYFLVDYNSKKLWFREQYSNVRISL